VKQQPAATFRPGRQRDRSGRAILLRSCLAIWMLALSVASVVHVHGAPSGGTTVSSTSAQASTTGPCLACINRHAPTLSAGPCVPHSPALLVAGAPAMPSAGAPATVVSNEQPSRAPPTLPLPTV